MGKTVFTKFSQLVAARGSFPEGFRVSGSNIPERRDFCRLARVILLTPPANLDSSAEVLTAKNALLNADLFDLMKVTVTKEDAPKATLEWRCPHYKLTFWNGPRLSTLATICERFNVAFPLDCCENDLRKFDLDLGKMMPKRRFPVINMTYQKVRDFVKEQMDKPDNTFTEAEIQKEFWQIIRIQKEIALSLGKVLKSDDAAMTHVYDLKGIQVVSDPIFMKMVYYLRASLGDFTDHGFRENVAHSNVYLTGFAEFKDKAFGGVKTAWAWLMKKAEELWTMVSGYIQSIYSSPTVQTVRTYFDSILNPIKTLIEWVWETTKTLTKKFCMGLMVVVMCALMTAVGFKIAGYVGRFAVNVLSGLGIPIPESVKYWLSCSETSGDWETKRSNDVEEEIRIAFSLYFFGSKSKNELVERLRVLNPSEPGVFEFAVNLCERQTRDRAEDVLDILIQWERVSLFDRSCRIRSRMFENMKERLRKIVIADKEVGRVGWRSVYADIIEKQLQEIQEMGHCSHCIQDGEQWTMSPKCLHREGVTLTGPPVAGMAASGFMTGLVGAAITGNWPSRDDTRKTLTFLRTYGGFAALGAGAAGLGGVLCEMWPKLIGYYLADRYFPASIMEIQVKKFVDRCELLFKASHSAEVLTTESFRKGVEMCNEEAHKFYRMATLDTQMKRTIGIYHTKLLAMLPATFVTKFVREDRMAPFVVHLYGEPGKGKSLTLNRISKMLPTHLTYFKPVRGEHWNGASTVHKYIFWDEFLMHDPEGSQSVDFLSLASTGTFMPDMASIDNVAVGIKGTKLNPEMVYLASNYGWPNSQIPREAIYRRRNLLVEVALASNAPLDAEGKLEMSKINKTNLENLTFVRYRLRNTMTAEGIAGEWLSFDSLMGLIAKHYANWKETNFRLAGSRSIQEKNSFERAWDDMEHAFSVRILTSPVSPAEWLESKGLTPRGPKVRSPCLILCNDRGAIESIKAYFARIGVNLEPNLHLFKDQRGMILNVNALEDKSYSAALKEMAGFLSSDCPLRKWKGFCAKVLENEQKSLNGEPTPDVADDSDSDSASSFHDANDVGWSSDLLKSCSDNELKDLLKGDWSPLRSDDYEKMYMRLSEEFVQLSAADILNPTDVTRDSLKVLLEKVNLVRKHCFVKKLGLDVRESGFHRRMSLVLSSSNRTGLCRPPPLCYSSYELASSVSTEPVPVIPASGVTDFLCAVLPVNQVECTTVDSFGIPVEPPSGYDLFKNSLKVLGIAAGVGTIIYLIYKYFTKGKEEIPLTKDEVDEVFGETRLTGGNLSYSSKSMTPYDKEGWSRKVAMRRPGTHLSGPTPNLCGPSSIKKAVCQISFDMSDGMYSVCLGDNYFLCNAHFFADFDTGSFDLNQDFLYVKFVGDTQWIKCKFDKDRMVVNEMYDIAIFRLSPGSIGFRGSIIKTDAVISSFISDNDLRKIGYTTIMVLGGEGNTQNAFAKKQQNVDPIRVKKWIVSPGDVLHATNLMSVQGDCGRPWMITSGECLNKVAAIHMAVTDAGTSYGAFVTQELLKAALASLVDGEVTLTGPVTLRGANVIQWRMLNVNEKVFVPNRTKLVESPIADYLYTMGHQPEKQPAPLSSGDYRVDADVRDDPARRAFNQRLMPDIPPAKPRVVELARRQVKRHLKENLEWPVTPRILTPQEAVGGVPGKLASVTMSSSPGWPLLKFATEKGKRSFLRLKSDGLNLEYEPTEALLEELEMYDRYLSDPENTERPDVRWLMYTKDELRPIEKIKRGAVRLTACGPLALWVKAREMTGTFMAALNFSWRKTGYAVGCNPNSYDMNFLLERLIEYNNMLFAGDGKNWDVTLHKQFIDAALQTIGEICEEKIPDFDMKKFEALCDLIVNSPMQFESWLVWIQHGQRSGNIFTTVMNCMIHDMYWRYAFLLKCPQHKFDENVRLVVCGDDILVAVKNEIRLDFDDLIYSREIAKIGQTYTNDDKKSALTGAPRPIDKVTFLGCHPKRRNGKWYGALRKSSIWDLFFWMEKGADWALRLQAGLKFMSGWGESEFNASVNVLREAVQLLDNDEYERVVRPSTRYACDDFNAFLYMVDHELILEDIVNETTFNRSNWLWTWTLCNGSIRIDQLFGGCDSEEARSGWEE